MGAVNIKGTRNKVFYFLELSESSRDSDEKLLSNYWVNELRARGIDPSKISAFELLKIIADGKMTNPQSIFRARRKIQENVPELRGKNYKERKKKEEEVKEEIRTFDNDQ